MHTHETKMFWYQNLQTMCRDWIYVWYDSLFFLDGGKEIPFRDPRFNDILEKDGHVGRNEQHSTKFGLSRSLTVNRPKCRVWTASGGKRKDVSEVWWSMVCVCKDMMFLTLKVQDKLQKLWGWNFLCKSGAQHRNVTYLLHGAESFLRS
jgi:hypothetical protein